MIVPDLNLLVYAHNTAASSHEAARTWWSNLMNRERPVGMPWSVSLGFVRLVTHPAVLSDPIRPLDALRFVLSWLDRPHVRVLEPGPRHLAILADLFGATSVAGSLTTDTYLAVLAIEHQAELHTNDGDFERFPGLRHCNPLR